MSEPTYLFVCTPHNSGSTLLASILASGTGAAALPAEGQKLTQFMPVPSRMGAPKAWTDPKILAVLQDDKQYNWDRVKADWGRHWATKPGANVLVEKSPPNVARAGLLQAHFPGARFVVGLRDPYAFVSSMWLRHRRPVACAAAHWLAMAKLQVSNLESLRDCLLLTYETLTGDPAGACKALSAFAPGLGDLTAPFIVSTNAERIEALTLGQLSKINNVLGSSENVLKQFGYALLESPIAGSPAGTIAAVAGAETLRP